MAIEDDAFTPIIEFFQAATRQGERWGSPWGILFPAFLALFFAVALFGGLRYAAQKVQEQITPWLAIIVLITGILLLAAFNSERLSTLNDDPAGAAVVTE